MIRFLLLATFALMTSNANAILFCQKYFEPTITTDLQQTNVIVHDFEIALKELLEKKGSYQKIKRRLLVLALGTRNVIQNQSTPVSVREYNRLLVDALFIKKKPSWIDWLSGQRESQAILDLEAALDLFLIGQPSDYAPILKHAGFLAHVTQAGFLGGVIYQVRSHEELRQILALLLSGNKTLQDYYNLVQVR